jgi:endo-1,4-beta-mannosidase
VTFELGINYWPRRSAMYMWRELDLVAVRDEMAHIADMGFEVVRVFALTEDFLSGPTTVEPDKIRQLVQVVEAARDAGLRVVPTLIVLNMSGRIWWPSWMHRSDGTARDLFSDEALLRAQALLVDACARALAGDAAVRAFDIANEIDDAQRPRSREAAREWAALLSATIRHAAPGTPIQIGAHLPSLTAENNMRVDDLGTATDEDVMHAYPLYYDGARSPLDPELVPFSCALTSALSGSGRPTLMQEFGLCTDPRGRSGHAIADNFLGQTRWQYLASEREGAEYYAAVLERLASTGAAGAYAWCYADYDPSLFDRPPLDTAVRERSFGLVRSDGSEKPAADIFRQFRKRLNSGRVEQGTIPRTLDVSADEYYTAPRSHFDRLYARWLADSTA